ncbi:MAG: PAS domain S-box protein [bacterium]
MNIKDRLKRYKDKITGHFARVGFKRNKELNLLYSISRLTEKHDLSPEELLQGIVDRIPPAYQYPEVAGARIILKDRIFVTDNFRETVWKQASGIKVHGQVIGTLEVCYLEEKPESDEGPFSKEEKKLINAIAERTGKIIERKNMEEERRHPGGVVSLSDSNECKQAEETRSRLAAVVEYTEDGIISKTLDGLITSWNHGAERIYGYPAEEAIGRPISLIFPPESLPDELSEILEKLRRGESIGHYKTIRLRKDGKRIHVELTISPLKDATGRIIGAAAIERDITEQKRMEEELKQYCFYLENTVKARTEELRNSQKQMAEAQGLAHIGSFEWNIAQDKVSFSDELFRILGIEAQEPEQSLEQDIVRFIHSDDQDYIRGLFEKALRDKEPFEYHPHRIVRPDGVVRQLQGRAEVFTDASKPLRIVGFLQDITERKQAEDARRETEEKYRLIVENTQEGIWIIDAEAKTTFVNSRFAEMLGYTVDEMLGKPIYSFMTEQNVALAQHYFEHRKQGINERHEFELLHKDGSTVYASLAIAAVFDDRGRFAGAQALVTDITERKRARNVLSERQRLFNVLEALPTMICLLTPDYHVAFANRAFREKFGESYGRHCYEYCFGRTEPCEFCEAYHVLKTGQPHHWEVTIPDGGSIIDVYDFPFTDVDGSPLILEMDIDITRHRLTEKALRDLNETLELRVADRTLELQREVTERKQAEEALRQAKYELEIKVKERTAELRQTNERLKEENQERIRTEQSLRLEEARLDALLHLNQMGEASLKEITGFTLEQAIKLTHSKIGFVGFLNEDESIYTLHAVSKDVVKECDVTGDPLQWHTVDAGIWADAIREHKTLFINDYSKPHPRKKGLPPGHPYVERFMVVPILEGERAVAVVGVGNKASDYDKSDERQIVLLLSGMWGYVQKNRSREELRKAYSELEEKVKQRTAELVASNAALKESQKDLNRAQEVGQIGSWRLDVRRNELLWSDENHRIFGVPKGTPLTYETIRGTVHPDDRQYVDTWWNVGLRGEPYDIEHRIVVNGQVKWVREKSYPQLDDAGNLLGGFGITQDITERKQAEIRITRHNRILKGISRIFEEALTTRTEEEFGTACLDVVEEITESKIGFIGELGPDGNLYDIAISNPGWKACRTMLPTGHRRPPGEFKIHGIYGRVLLDGKGFFTNDPPSHPDSIGLPPGHPPLTSFLGVPLVKDGHVTGMVAVGNREGGYGPEQLEILEGLVSAIVEAFSRKRVENVLRETSDYLEKLIQYANAPIIVWNPDMTIARFNHAFEHLTEYAADEIIGQKLSILFPESSRDESLHKINRALSGEYWQALEIPIRCKAGAIHHVLWNSANIYAEDGTTLSATIAQGVDITERKQAEEKIYYLAKFPAENPNPVMRVSRGGKILYANNASLPLLTEWSRAIGEYLPDKYYQVIRESFDTRQYREMELKCKDHVFSFFIVPIVDADYANLYGRDITAYKLAEEEKAKIQDQLLQSQKMEAIGILAGGVAHDFNNLLTTILGYTTLALMHIPDSDPASRDLHQVRKSADRAVNLTRQLLLFSRKQLMEPIIVDLNRIIDDLLKMLYCLIGEDITIITEPEFQLWPIMADEGTIEQVIMNLVVNARDAMPKGGKLTIKTENVTLDEEYAKTIFEARAGHFVRLSVADTGNGMDAKTIEQIFEPFFTTKGVGKGSGLGLSVAYGIVKQHEGWINVYSDPGKGSVFKIYLPALSAKAKKKEGEAIPLQKFQGKGERILIVEDEEEVRKLTVRILRDKGYSIIEASNVQEALEIFEQAKRKFDLVLSDVVLPDQTGIELVEQLLSRQPEIRVLLVSGYTDQKSQWPKIKERGFRFLQKPYDLAELLRTLREILETGAVKA